jgi:hypothetical protein
MFEKRKEAIPLLNGLVNKMHEPPTQLHLLLQVVLQRSHIVIQLFQSQFHQLFLVLFLLLHLDILLRIDSCLPIDFLFIGLVRN